MTNPNTRIFRCMICNSDIGTFDPEKVKLPIKGLHFGPLKENYPDPAADVLLWHEMSCLYCGHNPFAPSEQLATGWVQGNNQGPDRILTPEGFVKVGQRQTFICPDCGKPCKTQNALNSHSKAHKPKNPKPKTLKRKDAANG